MSDPVSVPKAAVKRQCCHRGQGPVYQQAEPLMAPYLKLVAGGE